jgi:hypothetical protein
MAVEDRKEALTRLAQAEGPYLITNARCLTEGIDVPALDAVAFADPRRSQVDIVQAVGRAMRKPRGTSTKTTGYIILPVFLSEVDLKDPETAVEASAFAPVLQVLRALKAHDPYRAPFFAKILVEQGKRSHKKGEGIDEILQVSIGKELDRALAKQLGHAVQLRALEIAADRFATWMELLKIFLAREGHTLVPAKHIERGMALGRWINRIRISRETLDSIQTSQLVQLGFSWNVPDEEFERKFKALEHFIKREGHPLVPLKHIEGGERLGIWVGNLRTSYQIGTLSENRIKRLERVGFSWNSLESAFEQKFILLQRFIRREGNANVPPSHVEDGVQLGRWVIKLRTKKMNLSPERIARLEAISFVWDALGSRFEQNLRLLEQFVKREGHARVPAKHVEGDARLGIWVNGLRTKRGRLSATQRKQLDRLGFAWSPLDTSLEQKFTLIERFVAREGHARIPLRHVEEGVQLGNWVGNIRGGNIRLSKEQMVRLEKVGFIWDAHADIFERNFVLLARFVAREGHARVPRPHVEEGVGLGRWVVNMRERHMELSPDRIARLEQLGFVWRLRSSRK